MKNLKRILVIIKKMFAEKQPFQEQINLNNNNYYSYLLRI